MEIHLCKDFFFDVPPSHRNLYRCNLSLIPLKLQKNYIEINNKSIKCKNQHYGIAHGLIKIFMF